MSLTSQKKSHRQRKFVNEMRSMADVPWPARKHKYPATYGGSHRAAVLVGTCSRTVGEQKVRTKRFRRKETQVVKCGGPVYVRRNRLGRHRAWCEHCRARKQQRRMIAQLQQRARRFAPPAVQAAEDRKSVRLLRRFQRSR